MLSVLIVLVVTFSAINISNYVSVENNASNAVSEVIRQGTDDVSPGEPPNGEPGNKVELREVHYFVVSFNQDGSLPNNFANCIRSIILNGNIIGDINSRESHN